MSDNGTGHWLPLETGNRWQRLWRRVPLGVVILVSVVVVLPLLALWHARDPSLTSVAGAVSFLLVAAATSAGFARRDRAVWVNFTREEVRIGSRLLRFADIHGAQQRSSGQFQSPTVVITIRAGRAGRGSVYLRYAGKPVTDAGCRNRLVALIERSGLPRSITEPTPGFAGPLPGTPMELSKVAALALVLGEPTLIDVPQGAAG